MMNSNVHKLVCSPFSLLFLLFVVPSFSLNLDGTLLLSFKYSIIDDPLSVLENWDYSDETPCLWTGVTCSKVETSTRVINLVLSNSNLLGSIPEDLGLIQNLKTLDLSNNFLNGTLPNSLFNASELQVLDLSNNALSGALHEFGKTKSLRALNLSANALSGKIPESVTSLEVISLRGNYFFGEIPSGFHEVEILDLSSNLLNGSLPMEFGGEKLRFLNFSSNKLSGLVSNKFAEKIPENCTIDLSFNNLTGEIPEAMPLSKQNTESFTGNVELCGKPLKKLCSVPSTFSKPPHSSINSSSSSSSSSSSPVIAVIPKTNGENYPSPNSSGTSTNNDDQIQPAHGLKPGVIAGITVGDLAGIGVLALLILYVYQLRKKKTYKSNNVVSEQQKQTEKSNNMISEQPISVVVKDHNTKTGSSSSWSCLKIKNGEETSEATGSDTDDNNNNNKNRFDNHESNERSLTLLDEETNLDFETLLKASAYILGSSGFGIVYKAVLHDGTSFAVRRIGENSALLRLKEFENQVRGIAKLKHPNLVKVTGFYWGNDEKLLICDYVSNGSLEVAGSRKISSSQNHLSFDVRLKIARGVARGLTYIHDKKHVHGNIKPSNILLNQEMEPMIGDLGLQWLIYGNPSRKSEGSSARHFGSKRSASSDNDRSVHGSPIGCTSPYHAPESHRNMKASPKWDVYSFGVLLLELLTGKVYSNQEFRQWSRNTINDSVKEDKDRILTMVDPTIRSETQDGKEEITLGCFELGFSCASLNPQKRPSMKCVSQILDNFTCSN